MHENLATITISCTLLRNESCRKCLFVVVSLAFISVAFHQGCSLGLDVSVSRRSRDSFAQRLGLVSVSEKCGNVSVSVSGPGKKGPGKKGPSKKGPVKTVRVKTVLGKNGSGKNCPS